MKRKDVMDLIAGGESSGVEFKLDNIRPEQLAKEVVALANLKGGHILLGVADDKTVTGITRDNLSEWVADTVFGRYIHPVILPYYEEVPMDSSRRVAIITIGQEISKPYVVRDHDRETAYVRIGAISRPATREQLLMLGSSSGVVHSEIMPVNRTSFESLDKARLENYLRDILRDPEVPETRESWITRMKALGFMTDGITEEPVCTIAGLNLFGIKPRQTLKQSGIRLMFFDALDKEYQALLDKVLDAPLVGRFQVGKSGKSLIDAGLIEKCLEAMEPFVTQEPNHIDENFRREKRWFYPFEAIRELLINALAHRDWTRFVDVEIAGYSDRLEIISPGALPNAMTVEKMVAGQRSARNLIIVEVLRDYGYVDARGMGVRTKVIPALKAGGVEPVFQAADDYVKTLLRKTEKHLNKENASLEQKKAVLGAQKVQKAGEYASLTSFQVQLVAGIDENPSISYDALAEKLNKNRTTVMRNIQKLKEMGVLKRIGSKKAGHWEVIG
ncbi:MAG: winged helix-turn-helix transcriptional regulator [Deltaproteobacteria bacterium]|jgi:ATP-dependent DNA helicase RecG|nr:winged helix-turn-helix transcriptional regulator [Deltaproteobacteria bacterium]